MARSVQQLSQMLPSNWSSFTPASKIKWFNDNKITVQELLSVGVSQSDIDWMKSQPNGYKEPEPPISRNTVIEAYTSVLGRNPNSSEIDYWVNYSAQNGQQQTQSAFLAGARNELSNNYRAAYQQYLGRTPSDSEVNFWVDYTFNNGFTKALNDFTVGVNIELEQRQPPPEPQPSVSEQAIRDAYQRYLNRTPDANEIQSWLNYSKTNSAEQTANAFLAGARQELADVTRQGYQAALNRAPTDAEINALVDYAIQNGAVAAAEKFNQDAQAELSRAQQPATETTNPVEYMKGQLRRQYDAVVSQQPDLKYKFEDRLDRLFEGQAKMLADAGITDITQVGRRYEPFQVRGVTGGFGGTQGMADQPAGASYLIDKRTGQQLQFKNNYPNKFKSEFDLYFDNNFAPGETPRDSELGRFQFWGDAKLGSGSDQFYIVWNDQDQPVFLPLWRDTTDRSWENLAKATLRAFVAFNIPYLGEALHSTAVGQALGATGSQVVAGAVTGAGIAELTGGDPLKGFVAGGLGSFTSTQYATEVGKALGITNEIAARVVGNGVINSLMSGAQAELLGGDVGQSMLAGFGIGAITANPAEVANLLAGGEENIRNLVKNTNISVAEAQNIITTSAANSLVTQMRGGDFFNALGENLIAGGLSQSAANSLKNVIGTSLSPETRNALVTTGKGIVDTGARAVLNNQNVGQALEAAAPYILTAGAISYQQTRDFIDQNPKTASLPEQSKLLLATLDTGTLSDAVNSLDADVLNSFARQTTELPNVTITAKRTLLDDALKLATDVWDRMSSFLGTYANYQKDQVVRSIIGLANVTQAVYGVAGGGPEGLLAGNIQALDRVKQSLNQLLSAEAIQDRAASLRILKEAEQGGFLDQVISGFQAFAQDPAGYTSEALGSVVPNLVMAGVTSGASMMSRLVPQIGINVAQTLGDLKNAIYEAVYTQAKRAGLTDVEAVALGTQAQAYGGPNTDMQAMAATIGAASTVFPGSFEAQLINNIAAKSARDVVLRAGSAGLIETATEGVASVQNSIAQNLAVNRIPDPREQMIREVGENTEAGRAIREMINQTPWQRALTQGTWGQAVVDALSGGIVGAGASLGLSAADINQWAQENAVERGDWEVLDAPGKGSELIVKNFFDPEVIDVFVREVGAQALPAPEGSGVDTPPSLPPPTDQDVIDVTDIVPPAPPPAPPPVVPPAPPPVVEPTPTPQPQPTPAPSVNLREQVASILTGNLNNLQGQLNDVTLTNLTAVANLNAAQIELQNLLSSGQLGTLDPNALADLEANLNNLVSLANQTGRDRASLEAQINQIGAVQNNLFSLNQDELQIIIENEGLPAPEDFDFTPFPDYDIVTDEETAPDLETVPETEPDSFQPPTVPTTPVDLETEGPPSPPPTDLEPEKPPIIVIDPESPDIPTVFPTPETEPTPVTPPDVDEEPLPPEELPEDETTPLRPTVIFETPDRPGPGIPTRVTGEGLASILGAKKPLFAGDPEEQRAVWNRRSLRLRRALGL